jgi:hypothetical protein
MLKQVVQLVITLPWRVDGSTRETLMLAQHKQQNKDDTSS